MLSPKLCRETKLIVFGVTNAVLVVASLVKLATGGCYMTVTEFQEMPDFALVVVATRTNTCIIYPCCKSSRQKSFIAGFLHVFIARFDTACRKAFILPPSSAMFTASGRIPSSW